MTVERVVTRGIVTAAVVEGDGPAVLVLHGFMGRGEAMRELIDELAADHLVIAPDLVGHGETDAPADVAHYRTEAIVEQLAELLDAVAVDDVALVGYSFGARMGLSFAVAHPDRVRALVLIGATAGIDDGDEATARRASDAALAARIETEGVEAFVDFWEQLPIFATQQQLPADVRNRIRRVRVAHPPHGLANSLRGAGTGSMPPLWDRLPTLAVPVRVIAGSLDAKYVELGQRFVQALPAVDLQLVDDVGHAVHTEAPRRCAVLVAEALR